AMETQRREHRKTCAAPALGFLGVGTSKDAYCNDLHLTTGSRFLSDDLSQRLRGVRFRLRTPLLLFDRGKGVLPEARLHLLLPARHELYTLRIVGTGALQRCLVDQYAGRQ